MSADEWWETERVASYLRLKPAAVREGAARGRLPGHKYPLNSKRGRWRFKQEELDLWLQRKPQARQKKGVTVW